MARKGARRSLVAVDIKTKRPDETYLQWRSRLARLERAERDRNEPLVTREAQTHGDYHDESVMHVESFTLAVTKRNHEASQIERMRCSGALTEDQAAAAVEIAEVAWALSSDVWVRTANMESRIDNPGAGRDHLVESMGRVRLEAAYSKWRERLPMPRRMVIDMITLPQSLAATARSYRTSWPIARKRLIAALDGWLDVKEQVFRNLDEDDVILVYRRLGCGHLRAPRAPRRAAA